MNDKQPKIISQKIIEEIENEGWSDIISTNKNKWSKKEIIEDLKKQRMEGKTLKMQSGTVNSASNFVNTWGTSTTTSSYSPYGEKELIKVEVKDITVEISYKQKTLYTYTNNIGIGAQNASCNNPLDRVWKEIYGLKDGKMTLLQVVQGKHVPAQYIPEYFEFDDEE